MAPRSQAGGSLLPNEPVNWTSTTASNFAVAPTTGATGTGSLINAVNGTTVSDSAGVNRLVLNPTAKTIVDGSATSLFTVQCPTSGGIGGFVNFLIFAGDATNFQADAGILNYSAVNKAGTSTATITYVAANEAKAVSSGTLTLAFTAVDSGSGLITYKLQPTGSLTETTYTITYTVYPLAGVVTIL